MTVIGTCPKCKSHLVKEVNESEVFHVSKNRRHVYNSVRKESNACYAAMRIVGLELDEKKGSNKKKGKG